MLVGVTSPICLWSGYQQDSATTPASLCRVCSAVYRASAPPYSVDIFSVCENGMFAVTVPKLFHLREAADQYAL